MENEKLEQIVYIDYIKNLKHIEQIRYKARY